MDKRPIVQMVFYNDPDAYPPTINAISVLAENGFDVHLICLENPSASISYPSNAIIKRIPRRFQNSILNFLWFMFACWRHAQQDAIALIAYDSPALLPAKLIASRHKLRMVYHCHDFVEESQTSSLNLKIFKQLEKWIAPSSDLVVVPDAERGARIAQQLNLDHSPLIIANAVYQAPPKPCPQLRDAIAQHGKSYDKIIFRPGYISQGHTLENTIRSIPLWEQKKWGFVIMGRGSKAYKQSLQDLAAQLGVADQFLILDPIGYNEILSYTVGADLGHGLYDPVHINNRYITTASNKIMEYMAAGVPCIINNTNSSRQLVEQYPFAALVNDTSPKAIAEAIHSTIANQEVLKSMSNEAHRAFKETFNYSKQYQPMLDYLKAIQ